ncbi:MAG: matrixin family metalloprotease [SAR202 cluster bacterium]|jgi:hypothetical protein|nr:matrixin family metalloprotease [SAR202 cluster bacterium]
MVGFGLPSYGGFTAARVGLQGAPGMRRIEVSKRNLALRVMALTLLPVLLLVTAGVVGQSLLAEPGTYDEVIFEDSEAHAGPGPHPDTESKQFKKVNGGIKWPDSAVVRYKLDVPLEFEDAVLASVATLDDAIDSVTFVRDDLNADANPCSGTVNTIDFSSGPVDGDGGVLAAAAACFQTNTKVIAGFRMRFDSGDLWSTVPSAGTFDVQNVATHEMGHVMGLAHVNAAKDGCLTMYKFSDRGETQKRTLGWGENRGLDQLYNTGNSDPGPGCGN